MGSYIAEKEYPEIKLSLSNIYLIDALADFTFSMSKMAQEAAHDQLKKLG
jgi:NADH dehydrogenase